jgi:hypothetical protein
MQACDVLASRKNGWSPHMRQPSVAIYPSMVSVFSYIRISEILRKSLAIIRKFLKKKDPADEERTG